MPDDGTNVRALSAMSEEIFGLLMLLILLILLSKECTDANYVANQEKRGGKQ